jgi:hypothetical protein
MKAPGLTCKYWIMLERLVKDKQGLFKLFTSDKEKQLIILTLMVNV